ncbi:hypothetical protein V845_00277, partial [Staphylococcus aureus W85810]
DCIEYFIIAIHKLDEAKIFNFLEYQ